MANKTMFDNYDNPRKAKKEAIEQENRRRDRLVGSSNVRLLKNIKNEEIGVSAKQGSTFRLYFTFVGGSDTETLQSILEDMIFGCEIYNKRHQLLLRPSVTVDINNLYAYIELAPTEDVSLDYGNYYINLFMTDSDDCYYPLFTETDGVISIE